MAFLLLLERLRGVFPDLAKIPDDVRKTFAERIRTASDFVLPELKYFNNQPCAKHESLADGQSQFPPCQDCGIALRKHQRVGTAWLFHVKRGLIADQVGSGKSAQAAGLLAMLKEQGEMEGSRALVVCRPSALMQWYMQLQRMIPLLNITTATGPRQARIEKYLQPWDVCLIGYQMLLNDVESFDHFNVRTLIVDDVDALRNRYNKTSWAIKRVARQADRVVILNGTPLQKKLDELHSVLEPLGGLEVLGSEREFRRRYVRTEKVKIYVKRGGTARPMYKSEIVGYQNLSEFAEKIGPMTLRRTAADIDDVDLPVITPVNIFLDLSPLQKKRYEELQKGALKIIRDGKVTQAKAQSAFLRGAQICGGLATLGETDVSAKLDWVENKLVDGDLSEEKVVVFIHFKDNVRALQERLTRGGVSFVTIWGEEPNKQVRYDAQQKFWNDPNCRVLIGTLSIEQSLNLQCSRHLINVDTILNAARMTQLSGRIRRDGSPYSTVYVHNLFANETQEMDYLATLEREQGLADHVWDEQSDLYERLSPLALMEMVGRSR